MAHSLPECLMEFSKRIYEEIKIDNGTDSDMIMSPFSIGAALSMLYAGCDGKTKDQLKQTLFNQYREDDCQLHTKFSDIISAVNSANKSYQLHVANRLYPNAHFVQTLLPEYVDKLAKFYRSDLKPVDFGKPKEACDEINGWAREKTHGKIYSVLTTDSISVSTMLVIINAVYFKGNWLSKFDPECTQKENFYQGPEHPIELQLMRCFGKRFPYLEKEQFQMLGMPYEGDELSMYFFLPKTRCALPELEKILQPSDISTAIQESRSVKVNSVAIPRFRVETSVDLNEVLKRLGVTEMFAEDTADLSKINGEKNLFVSKVIHKAFIEVNEEGSEAAAVTAVTVTTKRCVVSVDEPVNFIADHPFMYVIYHKPLQTVLFMGRFCGK